MNDLEINTLHNVLKKSINTNERHLMTLFSIAIQTKSKKILELGVRDGHSSDALSLAASLLEGSLTSVDINPTPWKCPTFLSNYKFIQSDSLLFLKECAQLQRKFDFIFVDDWHSYEHVKSEIELIDKISDFNTTIALHDLMHPSNTPYYFSPTSTFGDEWANGGPFRALNELNNQRWEWATIPDYSGLTLLRKRSPAKSI